MKHSAVSFLQMVAAGDIDAAFARYIGDGFKHHNAWFQGDGESLRLAMQENAARGPGKILTIHQTIGEADRVAVHSHVQQSATDRGVAVVHLFRFDQGKIIEMWDVGQPLPEVPINKNGMF